MDDFFELGDLTLHWDAFAWSTPVEPPFFGSPFGTELFINTQDEEQIAPTECQTDAWQNLISNKPAIEQVVLNSTFEYYSKMRPKYAAAGPEWIEKMPVVDRPEQLRDQIELTTVTIAWPYEKKPVRVGLSFRCTWELEHGLGIVLDGTRVIDIGGADCAIL